MERLIIRVKAIGNIDNFDDRKGDKEHLIDFIPLSFH